MTSEPSGRLYSAVTKYWPRIAAGLVGLAVVTEWVIGGLNSNGALEFYVFAWAATTGGLWFLFEKAEKALSEESREKVMRWLRARDFQGHIASIPSQFAFLFDRVFGEKHWSRSCFNRSCMASFFAFSLVLGVKLWFGSWSEDPQSPVLGAYLLLWVVPFGVLILLSNTRGLWVAGGVWLAMPPTIISRFEGALAESLMTATTIGVAFFFLSVLFNFIPDYLSLLETRWVLNWAGRSGRLMRLLAVDFVATFVIAIGFLGLVIGLIFASVAPTPDPVASELLPHWVAQMIGFVGAIVSPPHVALDQMGAELYFSVAQISLVSAFFTSVWLWLYAASVAGSRVLLRMNSGVGFLLRVTDVERQPFRSMGFVSVIITSALFALGLPLVLL